jgi:hypothetical protein
MGSPELVTVKPLRFSAFLETVYNGSVTAEEAFVEAKVSKVELPLGKPSLFQRWEQVGSREQTNGKCGTFAFLHGCSHKELHDTIVEGVSWNGKNYMKPVFYSCDKPTCCVCFEHGWGARQSKKAELRLAVASARFGGKVEHIVASLAAKDYGLPYEVMKENTRKALAKRGVIAGAMIPHAFRGKKIFREGFHFHVMGIFEGEGYDRCRHCVGADCHKCEGFEGLTRRLRKEDGYLVKVLGERKTVGGTLSYELGHASVLKGVSRFHVLTYFGLCSYNNMPHVEDKKMVCPVCASELEKHNYIGVLPLSAFKRKGSLQDRMFDAEEDGKEVFIPMVRANRSSVEEDSNGAFVPVSRRKRSDG